MAQLKTIQDFAAALDGREYKQEITPDEIAAARDAGVVIIYGKSDDTTVLCGAIDAETDTSGGGTIYLTAEDGLFEDCPCDCIHSRRAKARAKVVDVRFCKGAYVWSYDTDLPHATFEIRDNQPNSKNIKFCEGIVIDKAAL